jgi:hypothetical protein
MSTLLDALGYLGDSLDKPGRAVRGLLAGRPDEAAAIVPFSDSMGLTDPSRRTSGRDILAGLGLDPGEGLGGTIAGMGTEMALDPLTYLGAGLGARLGSKAGEAATAAGPRFATTADDLMKTAGSLPDWMRQGAATRLDRIGREFPAALGEVDPASRMIGAGAEGVAFLNPTGDVTRLGLIPAGAEGRPISEHVLQASRVADYATPGSRTAVRAERLPFAAGVGDESQWTPQALGDFGKQTERSGIEFGDRNAGNVGMFGGRPVIIDPGALDALPEFSGQLQQPIAAAQPSALMRALIGLGGGDEATRAAIAAGRAGPNFAPGFGVGGAGIGANLGAWGRQ